MPFFMLNELKFVDAIKEVADGMVCHEQIPADNIDSTL